MKSDQKSFAQLGKPVSLLLKTLMDLFLTKCKTKGSTKSYPQLYKMCHGQYIKAIIYNNFLFVP